MFRSRVYAADERKSTASVFRKIGPDAALLSHTRSRNGRRRAVVCFFLPSIIWLTSISFVRYFNIRLQRFIINVFEKRKKTTKKKCLFILSTRIFGVRFILGIHFNYITNDTIIIHIYLLYILNYTLLFSSYYIVLPIIYKNIRTILYLYSRVRIVYNKNNIESVIPINLHFKILIGFHYYYFYKIYIYDMLFFIYLFAVCLILVKCMIILFLFIFLFITRAVFTLTYFIFKHLSIHNFSSELFNVNIIRYLSSKYLPTQLFKR